MGVSASGQVDWGLRLRYVLATLLVFASLFYLFYGPPLTERFRQAAEAECNRLSGANYRTYRLEWRTTTYESVERPRWLCWDTSKPDKEPKDLGWWVGI